MKKVFYSILIVCALVSCSRELAIEDHGQHEVSESQAERGELLVKFSEEMAPILDLMGPAATRSGIPSADEVLDILGAYSMERVFPVDPRNEQKTRECGMHLWYLVKVPAEVNLSYAMERLSALGEVSKVQTNRRLYRSPVRKTSFVPCGQASTLSAATKAIDSFNDPDLYRQWGYVNDGSASFGRDWAPVIAGSDAGCKDAWELSTGDPSIIVAVLDEGVMYNHPDLAANMWVNEAETFGSEEDSDGNGYAGDRYGYNFTSNSGTITFNGIYDSGHGTHVAGTIAAVNNNGIGCSGIAGGDGTPNSGVKIMSCQIFDSGYSCTLYNEARAMKYAADNGAVILQCSWGYNSCYSNPLIGFTPGPASEEEWSSLYPLEKEAIDYFIHNAGSPNGVIDGGLVIYASGNEYSRMSAFPAAYSGCISVSAVCADYTPASYSNYGSEVELSAPGGDVEYYCIPGQSDDVYSDDVLLPQGSIWSTLVEGDTPGYGYMDGTSMACPHVVGVAALGLSYAVQLRKHFTAEEFRSLLVSTAKDLDSYLMGEKMYYYNHTSAGASPTKMDLGLYKGKMGRLVDASALLHALENSGVPMSFPNLYLAPGSEERLDMAAYVLGGESLGYSASVEDEGIAKVDVKGSILTVRGVSEGCTNAEIKISDGSKYRISIIVRSNSGSAGWL